MFCETCGHAFKGGPRARFCPTCRAERRKEQSAACWRRKRLGEVRELGSVDKCCICGREYIVHGGNQRYCPMCAADAVAAIDRRQGLEWYAKHKDTINPARNVARREKVRGPHICRMCGQSYSGLRRDGCCSDSCRTDKRRLRQAQYDAARRGVPIPTSPPLPKKIYDWSDVDWSKSNREIATDTGRSLTTIWAARKRLQKEKSHGNDKKNEGQTKE